MTRKRRRFHIHKDNKQVAQAIKNGVNLIITLFFITDLAFMFGVGQVLWPVWLVDHQMQIIGILSLFTLILFLLSPIIIEVESNPRPLSGPGKDPHSPWSKWP